MLLVAAATGRELAAALGLAQAPGQEQLQGRLFPAQAHGRPVLALVTGIGVVNAALALGRAMEQTEIFGVLCVGVAGSFDLAAHPLGCARLVEREVWPDYGLLFSGACDADARALGFSLNGVPASDPAAVFASLAWDAPAEAARMGLDAAWLDRAASITVSGVSADRARARERLARFGPGLENMEGFAVAYAARLSGLPFAELRAVSNAVGARPPESWDLPGALDALGVAAQRLLASTGGPDATPNQRT